MGAMYFRVMDNCPDTFIQYLPIVRIFIKQSTRTNNEKLELCMYKASAKLL